MKLIPFTNYLYQEDYLLHIKISKLVDEIKQIQKLEEALKLLKQNEKQ